MTSNYNQVAFRDWLMVRKKLSKKASGDVVSRLNRCLKIESIEGHDSVETYIDALLQNPRLDNIPDSSRKSMYRSVTLFFEFGEK